MVLFEGGPVRDQFAVHVYQEVVPVGVNTDEGCAFNVELEQSLKVVVRLPEQRVVCIYLVYFQYFSLSAVQTFSIELDSSPWTVGCLQLTEKAKWLLLNYLALEFVDKLAERSELFQFVSYNFDKLLAVQHKAYPVSYALTYSLS